MRRPTEQRSRLFFTILALIILTPIVWLSLGAEAVFFAALLYLALAVRHDTRVVAAVGVAFLATCPFLLTARKEAVAERAANYAYYFMAISVLVQLEELLLERHGWLEHKLDLSLLLPPAVARVGRQWSAALHAFEGQVTAEDRSELAQLVQVAGTAALVLVFLAALFIGARPSVLVPLMAAAVLFPFAIWGLRLAVRVLRPIALLRAALALAILVLASTSMVWLYDLVSADRMARMTTIYDFVDHLDEARRTSPIPEGEIVERRLWTMEGVRRRVIYQQPAVSGASRIAYSVRVPRRALMTFAVATGPLCWGQPGDGVTFAIYIDSDQGTEQLFSTYLDPKENVADRRWHPYVVDLSAYAGQALTLIFETGTGPTGDYQYDCAGWGEARLLEP